MLKPTVALRDIFRSKSKSFIYCQEQRISSKADLLLSKVISAVSKYNVNDLT